MINLKIQERSLALPNPLTTCVDQREFDRYEWRNVVLGRAMQLDVTIFLFSSLIFSKAFDYHFLKAFYIKLI